MSDAIEVVGARTNNLKNIHCVFPHGRLTVVTGVSGSGKSSLAFDTLYAEGQRRFIESMSTYARQFLEAMRRPDVDFIHNIPPAIAIEQKNSVKNARSTIGTASEIHDYLRLLFAKTAKLYCPECDRLVERASPQTAAAELLESGEGARHTLAAPVVIAKKAAFPAVIREILAAGFTRVWARGGIKDLEEAEPADLDGENALWVVVDRLAVRKSERSRLAGSLELAFQTGHGRAAAIGEDGQWRRYYRAFACPGCGREFRELEPHSFSFMSPLGACPKCEGYGRVIGIDWNKVIPNRSLTLRDRPIAMWNTPVNEALYDHLEETTSRSELPRNKPIKDLTRAEWKVLAEGNGEFCGIRGFFEWLEGRKYKVQSRVLLAKYRSYESCPDCNGARLRPEALCARIDGKNIADAAAMTIEDLERFFVDMRLDTRGEKTAERPLQELRARLRYLNLVGLGYLTLSRQTRTLSGGEAQRINLAAALGSSLTETLYVLDEPTVGLHARDTDRLLKVIHALRDNGNTVVVVEHDPLVIAGADHIIDLGPAAGELGGEVVFEGESKEFFASQGGSLTARAQRERGAKGMSSRRRSPRGWIQIHGAREHNLKNLDIGIPLGVLCCVTGVSGSGKSTLAHDILYAAFKREREMAPVDCGEFDRIEGFEALDDIILAGQALLGRSTRSNPVTYVKAYDAIRTVMAEEREARRAGVAARDFSFNVEGGRCERCAGTGVEVVDMHFLADVEVVCADCNGKRFQRRVLEVHHRGKNIDEILDMTVDEALQFFARERKVVHSLTPLAEVGLGYIRLGQNTATMSGGELQRLKLASHLGHASGSNGRLAFLFDEPTTGLHASDLEKLLSVLHRLVDEGASVIVIEHNLDFIAHADYVIDLGPEGGAAGGRVVAKGPLEAIMNCPESVTGQWLRKAFPKP